MLLIEPRVFVVPPGAVDFTFGDGAVLLASRLGMELDPWQAHAVRHILARRDDGRWAASRVGLSVPRQQGKTAILEVVEAALLLHGLRVIASAHHFRTAAAHAQRLSSFTDHPGYHKKGRKVATANGRESIALRKGRMDFVARSRNSGRGLSADALIFDEAQELAAQTYASMAPLVSASMDPMQIFTGTPVLDPATGEVFLNLRDDAIAGTDERLLYIEYSADPAANPALPATWASANPGIDIRLSRDHVQTEYRALSSEAFRTERLGIWPDFHGGSGTFDVEQWQSLTSDGKWRPGRLHIAVDVKPDRTSAAIVAAGRVGEDIVLGVIRSDKGTHWVIPVIQELIAERPASRIYVDDMAADIFVRGGGVPMGKVHKVPFTGIKQAAGALIDAVTSGTVRHHDQEALNAAVRGAVLDRGKFQRHDGTEALVAASLAFNGARHMATRDAEDKPQRGLILS